MLLCLPLLALPVAHAAEHDHSNHHEHDHAHGEHGSLDAHEHGAASLDMVLEDGMLQIDLLSPAMNLLGFEHQPNSDADRLKVAELRGALSKPQALFGLPQGCSLDKHELSSPLFEAPTANVHGHDGEHEGHNDVLASYSFDCREADPLASLDFSALFSRYPGTESINVQLIGPNGQQGVELTAKSPKLNF
jgi:hypothetical protein